VLVSAVDYKNAPIVHQSLGRRDLNELANPSKIDIFFKDLIHLEDRLDR
jgi:hypothetical protein